MDMKTPIKEHGDFNYYVGQKWINTENGITFSIASICEDFVTIDDGKRKISSIDHMKKSLWQHLVKEGYYKEVL
jgi:hypothetical protein